LNFQAQVPRPLEVSLRSAVKSICAKKDSHRSYLARDCLFMKTPSSAQPVKIIVKEIEISIMPDFLNECK